MATTTDPAIELGEIAERLAQGASASGERFLAQSFGVEAWTTDFVRIIGCIYERIDLVERIVQSDDLDEGIQAAALQVLRGFRAGFNGDSLRQHWNTSGHGLTAMTNSVVSLKLLSSVVRPRVSYPKLTNEEVAEFIILIEAYLAELSEDGDEPEFIRQAIFDGLVKFKFQLRYVGWMGSGYVLDALREVMVVYDLATRHVPPQELDASAVLKGLGKLLRKVKETVDTAKSWTDSGTAVFETYKLLSSIAAPVLLLTQQGGG